MHRETQILHTTVATEPFPALTVPVHHGSTLVFDTVEEFLGRHTRFYDGYSYGLYGHPVAKALEAQIAALEGAERTLLAPSGMAAITLVNLAVLRTGDWVLLPDSLYGPAKAAARSLLEPLGIKPVLYAPGEGKSIATRLGDRVRLVWVEAPGSFGMEMQDIPAIVAAAHAAGAEVAVDGTWASPLGLRALDLGADYAVQALSKYVSGHSDVLMGSVSVADEARFRRLKDRSRDLGYGVSPDDCYLTLRGLGTLAVRLERQARSALTLARWLSGQPGIRGVLHPALPDDPGHSLWKRDFRGAGSVFSVLLEPAETGRLSAFLEKMRLFRIGASWGGLHSLVAPAQFAELRSMPSALGEGELVRISIGLEHMDDLRDDLAAGLTRYRGEGEGARATERWAAAE